MLLTPPQTVPSILRPIIVDEHDVDEFGEDPVARCDAEDRHPLIGGPVLEIAKKSGDAFARP
uniref:Uncharacterized protein n=1 Tax=Rhodococcus hoagii TaxID=43767 RepID=A0A1Z1UYJ7_RHOHA|nr:hypothetical protein pVAPB1475_0721 [Prescottella equi]ARX60560.1 hypothetical protein pVAPB1413_0723 [Prescottella equi]ARX60666.1 hypothetical protein pVAPB1533_0723 [Prescottella equi]